MVILVTGVAGFIGTNFMYYYLNKYPDSEILGIDKLTYAGNFNNLLLLNKKSFAFIQGDISNKSFVNSLFKRYDITSIINFAAESHVDRSIKDASIFIKSNVYGTFNLIHCSKQNLLKNNRWKSDFKYIQISTDEVYGSVLNNKKFSEITPIHPNNPYAASKASADLFVQSYVHTYQFPGIISRCSNNYGPYQHHEKFIPTIITKALNHQKIPIYGTGSQIRDWIHVDDHCSAIDFILHKGKIGDIYNIGGNNEWRNIDIAQLILLNLRDICNDDKITMDLIDHVYDRLGHDYHYAMNDTKIKTQLKWKPSIKFTDGIKSTINWYVNH